MLSLLCATYLIAKHAKAYEDCYAFPLFLLLGFMEIPFEALIIASLLGIK